MNEKWKIFSIIKETTQKTNGFGKEFSPLTVLTSVALCAFSELPELFCQRLLTLSVIRDMF